MPAACTLLNATALAYVADGQAKVSVLPPGAFIRPHSGPTDTRLRVHCTLAVTGDRAAELRVGTLPSIAWVPGRCFAFDESCEHEVRVAALSEDSASAAGELRDPMHWPLRVVLLSDIANIFLEPLDTFKSSVCAEGWTRFAPQLQDTWQRVRRD
jgi:aspartyl/asparaginyl beta-hydroxylase (cupin superfamily)